MTFVKESILQMPGVFKPQCHFMLDLFGAYSAFNGRATMENLSRYGAGSVRRISRWARENKRFDFSTFNEILLENSGVSKNHLVAVIDASFLRKSGKGTWGNGSFYNGCASRVEHGLEASVLALVDLDEGTAYSLDVLQSPSDLPEDKTLTDVYLQFVLSNAQTIKRFTPYLLADGFFAKQKFIDGIAAADIHLISKLRHDADLRYLYRGEKRKGVGRPKKYDGKVNFEDLSRMDSLPCDEANTELFTAIVHHPHFKRDLRVLVLVKTKNGKRKHIVLFSTDTQISGLQILKQYRKRFQIEFIFRDAKQFLGFGHAQVRDQKALHFFLNTSLSTLNILRLEDRMDQGSEPRVISISSWKRRKYNEVYLQYISSNLDLDLTSIKLDPLYKTLCNYGSIAA